MRSIIVVAVVAGPVVLLGHVLQAGAAGPACAGAAGVPRCRASWEEKRTTPPAYEIRSEYACARGRDPWHAPGPECRCRPACGQVYVQKRLYKSEGKATVERVPKYDVEMVVPQPCGCATCAGGRGHGWDPLGILTWLKLR